MNLFRARTPALAALVALAASAPALAASGLSIARCALGAPADCLQALKCGLIPEDRASVTLSPSGEVLVEAAHVSASENFAVLKRIANGGDRARILVLSPTDHFSLRSSDSFPAVKLSLKSTPMGHPDDGDGFLGYTFFQYRGKIEESILYSPGETTDVVVNARQTPAAVAVAIHHEFRHVVAGDFGRTARLALHGLPALESAVAAAETEAVKNAAQCP